MQNSIVSRLAEDRTARHNPTGMNLAPDISTWVNITVTYCPLGDTTVALEQGNTTFGVSGKLWQSCLAPLLPQHVKIKNCITLTTSIPEHLCPPVSITSLPLAAR